MNTQLEFIKDSLERLRRIADNGRPYWYARDIMEVLTYTDWRDFRSLIEKAKVSCDMAGNFSANHFVRLDEMVEIGSGAQRQRENFVLSQYACYLVAMNGDPGKPEIASSQAYFADQTYKQEQQDKLTEEQRRLYLRNRVKDGNKKLSGAAREAGVRNTMFGVFHDEGYKGLYGGHGLKEVKKLKGIPESEDFLDCIGRAELAANEFRITQTEEQLRKANVNDETVAIQTHRRIGTKVRKTIEEIGGTMPEKLPSEPSIKKLARQTAKELKKGD
jgi:DNA-damage-inducible protein D